MKPIGPTRRPHPEEVTRSLLRVTVSKDGSRAGFHLWPSFETARAQESARLLRTRIIV
jgi:Cft2 family RNA processing exonuclease